MSSTDPVKILAAGKFLRLCREGRWEWVERVNCTGVVILVALTVDQKVLLVEQYRVPCKKQVVEFPAGLVGDQDRAESLEAAAHRELLEETGYAAEEFLLLAEGPPSAGMSPEIVTFLLARGLKKIATGGGDETEQIQVHEISLDQVEDWLKSQQDLGKWVDPKVYAGLYFLKKE